WLARSFTSSPRPRSWASTRSWVAMALGAPLARLGVEAMPGGLRRQVGGEATRGSDVAGRQTRAARRCARRQVAWRRRRPGAALVAARGAAFVAARARRLQEA